MSRLRLTLVALVLSACSATDQLPSALTQTLTPVFTPIPTRTPLPIDTGWLVASDGIETRELAVTHQGRRDRLFIARVDPAQAMFQVRYDPEQPRRVGQWIDAEQTRLVVNGGFFDPDHRALGLLVADGATFGQSYEGLGGLFGVSAGQVQVRSLIRQPYQPGETFDQMVQSFPMLLVGGAINDQMRDDGRLAPRTVAGLDRRGRVVFLVSPGATFSLIDLAMWLAQSDLDLDAALNLDGGTSSGLIARTAMGAWGADSWIGVPAVIVVR